MNPFFRLLFITLSLSAGVSPAAAQGRVEFILDGSGSMWGDAGGEPKVVAAKRVMKDLLRRMELPADTKVGLTLYGHRRKGDCADIERLPPVDYAARESLGAAIDGLNPKGKTPIADSLRIVAESLKSEEGATSIVLVSDGIESCGKDPCKVAETVRERYGIDVTIHVVGFDVKQGQEQEQLRCIARAGGGQFHLAKDAAQLAKAFEEVQEQIVKVEPAPEPEPEPINVAAASNGGHIVLYSSSWSDRKATNLIDETQAGWASTSSAPQSIVIGFEGNRRARIVDLLINPHNKMDPKRWAKDLEIFVSDESPYDGYRKAGTMTLEAVGSDQVLTFDPPVEARYVKLNFMANHGDSSQISAGEVTMMGQLLDETPPPGPELMNVASAAVGASIEKASSEWSDRKAANLIDGTQKAWASNGATPQDVTIQLAQGGPYLVRVVAINPHNQMDTKRWAREVEIFTSEQSSYKGFISQGRLELRPVGEFQVLRLSQPAKARYLRLRFHSNHGGSSHISAGEVVVLAGSANVDPQPPGSRTSGSSNLFSGAKAEN